MHSIFYSVAIVPPILPGQDCNLEALVLWLVHTINFFFSILAFSYYSESHLI